MIRPRRATVFAVLVLVACTSAAMAGLRDDVDRLIRNTALKGATIAVSVRDSANGESLAAVNADVPMSPASNMKLLTSGAALHVLGAQFEFTTRLLRRDDKLIVVGDGDPALGDPELLKEMNLGEPPQSAQPRGMDVEAFLRLWLKPVAEAGIERISEVIVDDRIFDREAALATWPGDDPNRYCPEIAGLNFFGNVVQFTPRPRPGQPPEIGPSHPLSPWLKINNSATSRQGAQEKNDLWISRKLNSNDLTFRGNVRIAYRSPVAANVHDVPDFFARLLGDRLQQAGIHVGACRSAAPDDPLSVGTSIGPVICTPIGTVIRRCNTDSENLYAECLLKRVGHAATGEAGSWVNGTAIVRHTVLQRLGDPALAGGIVVLDGSGLSAGNRITARAMTAWLNSFANDEKLGPIFMDSLAQAGQSGTLQKRMPASQLRGAVVQAKTGFINQVSCLSGFVTMPDGRRRSFSVLVNGIKDGGTVATAKKLQDQIVTAIAEDMASTVPVHLGSD